MRLNPFDLAIMLWCAVMVAAVLVRACEDVREPTTTQLMAEGLHSSGEKHMARKAHARVDTSAPAPVKNVYGLAAQGKRKKELDDLGPILRITRQDIITLRDLCATEGSHKVAESIGIAEVTLLRAMAGLAERCIPRSTESLRGFLHKLNS